MKKMHNYLLFHKRRLYQIVIRMKLVCIAILISMFQLQASVNAQDAKIDMQLKDVNLDKVFSVIHEKTGYNFMFNHEDVSVFKVDAKFKNTTVKEILDIVLKDLPLHYRFEDNVVLVYHQEKTTKPQKTLIKGKVTDAKGNPLPGVSVIIKGTTVGISTDNKGLFKIELPEVTEKTALVFSFIGMETKEVKVIEGKEIKVILTEKKEKLEEVVITGYVNIHKESFTGNSVTVSKEELLNSSKTSIIQALQAFDPSFRIEENNDMGSNPNALPEMYIRGRSGIGTKELDEANFSRVAMKSNPNLPTFILDGFEVSIEKVFDYDINRIKNITILKDAAATAMYGSRAANGVVVITSESPKSGELTISYNITGSVVYPDLTDYNLMNAEEKLEAERLAGLYDPSDKGLEFDGLRDYYGKLAQISKGVDTYWLSKPLRTALNHKHSLYIEGGEKSLRFGFDLQYNNDNGVMKESFRDRKGMGFFLDYNHKRLQVRNQISYTDMRSQESPYGVFSQYTDKLPYDEYKDEDGKYLKELKLWQSGNPKENPLYEASLDSYNESSYYEFMDNLNINWYVNDYLQIKGQFSIVLKNTKADEFLDPRSNIKSNKELKDISLKGKLCRDRGDQVRYYGRVFTAYNRKIGGHNFNFNLGLESSYQKSENTTSLFRGFPSGKLSSPNYAKEIVEKPIEYENTTKLLGFISVVNYTFNDIYLFDASCRVDGSSEFGSNNRGLHHSGRGGVGNEYT